MSLPKNTAQTVSVPLVDIDGSGLPGKDCISAISKDCSVFVSTSNQPIEIADGDGEYAVSLTAEERNCDSYCLALTDGVVGTKVYHFPPTMAAEVDLTVVTDAIGALHDFDPASDVVAHVTLVDTTTTNTDMRGTDGAITSLEGISTFDPYSQYVMPLGLRDLVDNFSGASFDPAWTTGGGASVSNYGCVYIQTQSGNSIGYIRRPAPSADGRVSFKYTNVPNHLSYGGPFMRASEDASQGYGLFWFGPGLAQFQICKIGSLDGLGGSIGTPGQLADGDILSLECVGSTIRGYVNDVLVAEVTDTTYSEAGQTGVKSWNYWSDNRATTWDDFSFILPPVTLDIPTVDEIADEVQTRTISRVTLVDTTTELSNMPSLTPITDAIDALPDATAIQSATAAALTAYGVATQAAVSAVGSAVGLISDAVDYLRKLRTNKRSVTQTTDITYDDDGVTPLIEQSISDDGTTATRSGV